MTSIYSIGSSALAAAQAGLATTSHNIANAATPGYNRQSIVQTASPGQNLGSGFVGGGTVVSDVRRTYSDLLASQVKSSQSAQSATSTYKAQISQIDNLLADSTSGVAPALQDFFAGLQNLTANPQSASNRQALISSADVLSASFQTLNGQLSESRSSVNAQIVSSTDTINSYAEQIKSLNIAIAQADTTGHAPNDLMDQRDEAVSQLSKQVAVSVVKDGSAYNVSIGNGQPLVVGTNSFKLVPQMSASDPNRMEVAYQGKNTASVLSEASLSGGVLGGLFEYRSKSLDSAQNSLGRMAIVLADTFNAQHQLGLDQTGQPGGKFFEVATPVTTPNSHNQSTAAASASIVSAQALTGSDYRMQYDGSNYVVTQLSSGASTTLTSIPQTIDGVSFGIATGTPAKGDSFLIQPTIDGASKFSVLLTDVKQIAAASPILTSAPVSNTGSGAISAGVVDKSYLGSPLTAAFSLNFTAGATAGTGTISGFPDGSTQAYSAGNQVSFKGMTFTLSGSPATGDTFKISPNTTGSGDGSNATLLGGLQSDKTVGGTASFQNAYANLVSNIGNKTRELGVTQKANDAIATAAIAAQQSESGVNLDEEAANLLRYQQAYQAAGKMMQTASTLFDTLLSIMR
jgi:flagellar hook-associated protein 1 FlgK